MHRWPETTLSHQRQDEEEGLGEHGEQQPSSHGGIKPVHTLHIPWAHDGLMEQLPQSCRESGD